MIYELGNPTNRQNEDYAIADMRHLRVAEPHYHPVGEIEIYYVLQGSGLLILGGKEQRLSKDSLVVIPPLTAHFTLADKELVLAAVNSPAFKPEGYIVLNESNKEVGFDKRQFERLTAEK